MASFVKGCRIKVENLDFKASEVTETLKVSLLPQKRVFRLSNITLRDLGVITVFPWGKSHACPMVSCFLFLRIALPLVWNTV